MGQCPAEQVASRLAEPLGPHPAQAAVGTFSKGNRKSPPEASRPEEVPGLFDALRPMLRIPLGPAKAEEVLAPQVLEFP